MQFDPLCLFLCFKVRCLWSPCFGPWSTSFLRSFLWSFLFLSLAKIKQCLPPTFNKNSCHHRDSFRYSCVVLGHSQFCFCGPSWANALYCDLHHELHPHSNDWRNRKTHSKFANTQRDTTNLAVSCCFAYFNPLFFWSLLSPFNCLSSLIFEGPPATSVLRLVQRLEILSLTRPAHLQKDVTYFSQTLERPLNPYGTYSKSL